MTKEHAIQLYKDGKSLREIHRITGHCDRSVKRWLVDAGIELRNRFIKLDEEKVCNDYIIKKMSVKQLSKKYSVSTRKIYTILKRNNTDMRHGMLNLSMTDQEIIEMYDNGSTLDEIANLNDCSPKVIVKRLEDNDKKRRNYSESRRIYEINESYFDTIDDQNKAYILGLIFADGHVSNDKNVVSIRLQKGDIKLLEDIRDIIYPNKDKPIPTNKNPGNRKDTANLSISNKHIPNILYKQFNLLSKKANNIQFPYILDNELYRHFIRGYFDGDGSIGVYQSQDGYPRLKFSIASSSYNFLYSLQTILMESCGLSRTKFYLGESGAYQLTYSGAKQGYRIFNYLYDNSNLKMGRKYEKFKQGVSKYL